MHHRQRRTVKTLVSIRFGAGERVAKAESGKPTILVLFACTLYASGQPSEYFAQHPETLRFSGPTETHTQTGTQTDRPSCPVALFGV